LTRIDVCNIILLMNSDKNTTLVTTKDLVVQHNEQPMPPVAENSFLGLIGNSLAMQRVFDKVRMYALSDAPVLITGETGAGKEGIAAALHRLSKRTDGPFITMNCSAITDTLFESELFGHEKGSFTGALKAHKGRFERADKGTLFLDELGDLPPLSQAKLLRALETSQIERVGAESPIKVNVRVVAATNHNLEKESHENLFRADLFYRLNALQINVPPLRARPEDIEPLIQHFIKLLNKKYDRAVVCLTKEAVQLLKQYQWPGNVRELRNLMERLFAENMTEIIGLRALKEWYEERIGVAGYVVANNYKETVITPDKSPIRLGMVIEDKKLDQEDLKNAFVAAEGNITKASRILNVHKTTFYRAMKEFGLSRENLGNL
jgi:transcriptional regulator with GAF, ATPase, and Fis domain